MKVNEPVIVVVPVVGAPVVFDAAAVVLAIVVSPPLAGVVVPPLPAAVVVVIVSAAEPATHSVSNNWRNAILRAGVSQMRKSFVPAKTAAMPRQLIIHTPKLHNYAIPV